MLPIFAKKKMAGLIAQRMPGGQMMDVGGEVIESEESHDSYALKLCMTEFLHGIERKEPVVMAKAFKEAFELLEMMPHIEAEHEEYEGLE